MATKSTSVKMKSTVSVEIEKGSMKSMEKGEEELKDLINLNLERVLQRFEERGNKRKRKGLEKRGPFKRRKRKRNSKGGELDVSKQEETTESEREEKIRKVKVANLPVPVLAKVFSYLGWKDLGTAMLVCQRWADVGGHPLLWTGFPLHLTDPRLFSYDSSSESR